jgi:hypothetical protein
MSPKRRSEITNEKEEGERSKHEHDEQERTEKCVSMWELTQGLHDDHVLSVERRPLPCHLKDVSVDDHDQPAWDRY